MTKGTETRSEILDQALDLSSEVGLEGLTIGVLAKRAGMSKSGLYAHFASKESLQCQVLDAGAARFQEVVAGPAFAEPRGLPRIQAMFDLWLEWTTTEMTGGCPFIAAAVEFDDRPGSVRDTLVDHLEKMLAMVSHAARLSVEAEHFRADVDVEQFAYEYWSLLLGHHHFSRLMHNDDAEARTRRAFDELVARAKKPDSNMNITGADRHGSDHGE